MNAFAVIILVAVVGKYLLGLVSDMLNMRALSPAPPDEFADALDEAQYARSQRYTVTRTRFGLVHGGFDLAILLVFWFAGGFAWLDALARGLGQGPVVTGLFFLGALMLIATLLGLPWRAYSTFVIEARYGFNRTTVRTFVADTLKGLLLAVLVGGLCMAIILAFFEWAGALAWLWCWAAVTLFGLIVQFVAPTWIMPLFNKFTPLESGDLYDAIMEYVRRNRFPLRGVFVVDGSRRSSKANAFFTGFGKNKRIGLYDTLVDEYAVPELMAVLAHEVGHYKRKHILQGMAFSIVEMGVTFWILSLFLEQEQLFAAFYVSEPSVYAGLLFFALLFTPVRLALSIPSNMLSRRNEFEADRFAAETTGSSEPLVAALKKLSSDSLSNLTPHPLEVFLHHSHPPVLQRILALRQIAAEAGQGEKLLGSGA